MLFSCRPFRPRGHISALLTLLASACVSGVLAGPLFSPAGGVYTNDFVSVELTPEVPGNTIRFTLNGSDPTTNSFVYNAPLVISNATTIRAREFFPNDLPGPITSQTYIFVAADLLGFNSNLPLMILNTFGKGATETTMTPASLRVIDVRNGRCDLLGAADFDGRAAIAVRGNSSSSFPKQPYKLELRDEGTNDFEASLLGMPKESDWVLYPPYSDKTLMRNVLSYRLHEDMGRYAVRTRFVELFADFYGARLTRNSDYRGVYVLMEKIKRDNDRVNIQKLEPTDLAEPNITGGYIFKKDKLDAGEQSFTTTHGIQLSYVDPKQTELVPAQKTWLRNWLNEFESVLYGSNFKDPTNGYAKYIDIGSFIDQHWIIELTKNIDGFIFSNYMHKDRLGKINVDPIWDFDLALGNANYNEGWMTNRWRWSLLDDANYPWFRRLFQDPDFNQRYIDRWGELRDGVFATTNLLERVDEIATLLNEAQVRNFKRWPVLGSSVWPNYYVGRTYQDEVNWMKKWIAGRAGWIDTNYLPKPVLNRAGGFVDAGFGLAVTSRIGSVYYTLDGSDPRLPGGALSASAFQYTGPITLTGDTRFVARTRYTNAWSAPVRTSFDTSLPALVITELMYNPPPAQGSGYATEDFEFIELMNAGTTALDLSGIHFTSGVSFTFAATAGTLEPSERIVIPRNIAAFVERYGFGRKIAGQYSGSLNNAGEQITLCTKTGVPILDFRYGGDWYSAADGQGRSLVIRDELGSRLTWTNKFSWHASSNFGGSPGLPEQPETMSAWKTRYFSAAELADAAVSGENADPDGDGMSNLAEYLAGTDPLDPASRLCIQALEISDPPTALRLRFIVQPAKSYSVQYRDSITNNSWSKLRDIFPQSEPSMVEVDDVAPVSGVRYYRLVTPASQ